MRRIFLFLFCSALVGCASTTAPNGMTWQEYSAAKHRVKVTYQQADVANCQEVGFWSGSDSYGMSEAKEKVVEQAVLQEGNTVYFENLYSEWRPFRLIGFEEVFHADGRIYHCGE